jgi:hypothetical protein
MLFRTKDLEAIFAGTVTTAFRRWKRPTVKAGGAVRTQMGMVEIESIETIDPATLTEADATAANYPGLKQLLAMFESQEGVCYRITLRPGGPDPRAALQQDTALSEEDRKTITARLDKLDRAAEAPWTDRVLALIAEHPGVVSTVLADGIGLERLEFKERVRKLKALGLTLSLDVGYRLSPRGEAFRKKT